jgi:large subunit ribosomal protein L13
MKTITPSQLKGDERKWYVIDASEQTLGKLATQIAIILKGKNKVSFAPHLDNGDYVVVTNCDKFKVT